MSNIELLDYFAGQVLNGLAASFSKADFNLNVTEGTIVKVSYYVANEMLKERKNYFPINVEVTTAKQIT
jgi:hypothetical protein